MNNDIISTLTEARDDCAAGQSPRVSHDRLAQALTAVIKLFKGDSAEADVLGRLVEAWRGSSNPYLHEKSIAAATSGALALRALPQVMAEVERLRAALKSIALAGLSAPIGCTEEESNLYQANQARRFISIAANALEPHALNLLAVLHGDGGHYTAEHGFEKSCKDAEKRYYEKLTAADKRAFDAEQALALARDDLREINEQLDDNEGHNAACGIKKLQAALADAKAKQESTYQSLVRARAQTEACEEKIESLTTSCHSFDLQVRELEAENEKLRAELEAMKVRARLFYSDNLDQGMKDLYDRPVGGF